MRWGKEDRIGLGEKAEIVFRHLEHWRNPSDLRRLIAGGKDVPSKRVGPAGVPIMRYNNDEAAVDKADEAMDADFIPRYPFRWIEWVTDTNSFQVFWDEPLQLLNDAELEAVRRFTLDEIKRWMKLEQLVHPRLIRRGCAGREAKLICSTLA